MKIDDQNNSEGVEAKAVESSSTATAAETAPADDANTNPVTTSTVSEPSEAATQELPAQEEAATLVPSGVPTGVPGVPMGVPIGVPGMPQQQTTVPETTITTTTTTTTNPTPQPQASIIETAPEVILIEKGEVALQYVGRVIGKGGEQIRDLQARSGCKIDVDQNVPAGAPRVLTYQGTRKTIDFAKQLIGILCAEGGKDAELPLGEARKKQLQVPATVIGKIIGRGGEMIKVSIVWLMVFLFIDLVDLSKLIHISCHPSLFFFLYSYSTLGTPIEKSS